MKRGSLAVGSQYLIIWQDGQGIFGQRSRRYRMFESRAVYVCNVCGKEKFVDARVVLSGKTIFCCGVEMVKKRNGMIKKNGR